MSILEMLTLAFVTD